MKNNYLLRRNGRNQFDDREDRLLPSNMERPAPTDRDRAMWVMHREFNEAVVREHGAAWLSSFAGMSKKDVWSKLCPRGTPALSTFRSMAREYASFDEFMFFWMVSNKRQSLALLGVPTVDINEIMERFTECGRYYVAYGQGKRIFGTS
ncbi:hypothetical protein ACFOFO_23375 [Undibacterium arcticum]|uniref:Uncharacterized protein n=2 Tax=Undibacterium arcticum TaxID=1762892 RepID=A0ABV7F765_9BURK